jgi:hypothetical protein
MTNHKTVHMTAQWLLIAFFAMVVFVPALRTPTVRVTTMVLVVIYAAWVAWVAWRSHILAMTPMQIYRSGLKGNPVDVLCACMAVAAIVLLTV